MKRLLESIDKFSEKTKQIKVIKEDKWLDLYERYKNYEFIPRIHSIDYTQLLESFSCNEAVPLEFLVLLEQLYCYHYSSKVLESGEITGFPRKLDFKRNTGTGVLEFSEITGTKVLELAKVSGVMIPFDIPLSLHWLNQVEGVYLCGGSLVRWLLSGKCEYNDYYQNEYDLDFFIVGETQEQRDRSLEKFIKLLYKSNPCYYEYSSSIINVYPIMGFKIQVIMTMHTSIIEVVSRFDFSINRLWWGKDNQVYALPSAVSSIYQKTNFIVPNQRFVNLHRVLKYHNLVEKKTIISLLVIDKQRIEETLLSSSRSISKKSIQTQKWLTEKVEKLMPFTTNNPYESLTYHPEDVTVIPWSYGHLCWEDKVSDTDTKITLNTHININTDNIVSYEQFRRWRERSHVGLVKVRGLVTKNEWICIDIVKESSSVTCQNEIRNSIMIHIIK